MSDPRTGGSAGDGKPGTGNAGIGTAGNGAPPVLEAPHRPRGGPSPLARLQDALLLRAWRTASWLLGHLPDRPAYFVGGTLMTAGYYLIPDRRRWIRSNFGHVLGVPATDPAAGRLALAAYRNYARYIVELMRLPWLGEERRATLVEIDDVERYRRLVAESNGVILAGAHIGNNEAGAAGLVSHGFPITFLGDDSAYGGLYDLLVQQRESWGVKMVGWRNLRGVYHVLRRHEVLGLLIDWGYREDGIPVRLFDAWTTLPAGPAALAARHGSTILPFCLVRLDRDRFRIVTDEPIHVASSDPADLARATQAIADALARAILRAPEQWYIFKPIWPDSPDAERALAARTTDALAARESVSAEPQ